METKKILDQVVNHSEHFAEGHENSYALDSTQTEIFIGDAISGRNGYFCMGCKRELQAVKFDFIYSTRSYFRHDPKAVLAQPGACTYSDETHRHKLAKEVLVRLKTVRVPAVDKYHPDGKSVGVRRIAPTRTIIASTVLVEQDFFENEKGEIVWAKLEGVNEEKKSLIRPDVIFFDNNGRPILFIELAATHKVDRVKKLKLAQLGIDTIEVLVPRESPQAIEDVFSTTERTKWLHNNEQQRTDYFQLPEPPSGTEYQFDPFQKRILHETFACRSNEVKELIRRLRINLESEHYAAVEREITAAITRKRSEVQQLDIELTRIRTKYRDRVNEQFKDERDKLETLRDTLERQGADLRKREGISDDKFKKSMENVGQKETEFVEWFEREEKSLERNHNETIRVIEERRTTIRERFFTKIREVERGFSELFSKSARAGQTFRDTKRELENRIAEARRNNQKEESEISRIQQQEKDNGLLAVVLEKSEQDTSSDIEARRRNLPERFIQEGKQLEERFEQLRTKTIEGVKGRDGEGVEGLSAQLDTILSCWGLLDNFAERQRRHKRIKDAHECFRKGTFKEWKWD